MFVKPAPHLKVRDPQLKDLLPDEGRLVPDTSYWHRRVRDGDVVVCDPPAPSAPSDSDPGDSAGG